MGSSILSMGFLVIFFFLSGFISRIFIVPANRISAFPNTIDVIFGYAISSILCLLSLLMLHNSLYGGVLILILSLFGIFKTYREKQQHLFENIFTLDLSKGIKILFLFVVAAIYLPTAMTHADKYHLPDIFDLPKQLSAIISAAHAKTLPTPNPYFPSVSFAYNMLFYLPIGLIIQITQSINSIFIVYTFALLWVTWQMLSILEIIFNKLGLPQKYLPLAMIMATFFNGLTPALLTANKPVGFLLTYLQKTSMWVDDPFVSFIFVPQHIFSIICVMAAWCVAYSSLKFPVRLFFQLILFVAGSLSSYILAPLIQVFFLFFIIMNVLEIKQSKNKKYFLCLFLQMVSYTALVLPFLLQAKGWAHKGEMPQFWLNHSWRDWLYLSLEFGALVPLVALSIFYIRNVENKAIWISFSFFIILPLLFLALVHYPDSNIKSTLWLRFAMVPFATAGIIYLFELLSKRIAISYILIGIPFVFFILADVLTIGYFMVSAYQLKQVQMNKMITELQTLPFNKEIIIGGPDQNLAAESGHLCYMDMRAYRPDAYMPEKQAKSADAFFNQSLKMKLSVTKNIGALVVNGNVVTISDINCVFNKKSTLLNISKRIAMHLPNPSTLLTTPVTLEHGLYKVTITIQGDLEEKAYLSLDGFNKVINIPANNYAKLKSFSYDVAIQQDIYKGDFEFGLDGKGPGSENILLLNIQVQPIITCTG